MYLEGSDQHRGWFHSSLLESCGTRGRAPFDVVVTHGFMLDEQGRKMSKSLGNAIAPQDVIKQSGADILRLWVVHLRLLGRPADRPGNPQEHRRDLPEAAQHAALDARQPRAFPEEDRVAFGKMPELERLMLHRLAELDALVRTGLRRVRLQAHLRGAQRFMTTDLSAFYFDVRKDALYCDPISSVTRKACLTVLDHLFRCTVTWLAPMLCFTAEEAWCERYRDGEASVHLELFPDVPKAWRDDALAEKWRKVRLVRRVVTGALEIERAGKRIGSSLEADPIVHVSDPKLAEALLERRPRRNLHHLGRDAGGGRRPGAGVPAAGGAGRRGRGQSRRGPQMRALMENLAAVGSDPQYPRRHAARRAGVARMGRPAQGRGVAACAATACRCAATISGGRSPASVWRWR